jgi:hypothetical protein
LEDEEDCCWDEETSEDEHVPDTVEAQGNETISIGSLGKPFCDEWRPYMLMCKAPLIAVQMAAMIRNASIFFVV